MLEKEGMKNTTFFEALISAILLEPLLRPFKRVMDDAHSKALIAAVKIESLRRRNPRRFRIS
jgi:hypothetical protein